MNNSVKHIRLSKALASAILCVGLLFLSSCQNSVIPDLGKKKGRQVPDSGLESGNGSSAGNPNNNGDGGGGGGDRDSDVSQLMKAAADGDILLLQSLIASGIDINAQDEDGNTALHHAVKHDREGYRLASIQKLKSAGIDRNIKNKAGEKAIHIAAAAGRDELTIKELLG